MLKTQVRPGDVVDIDYGRITVRVEGVQGQEVRLAFEADRSIPIRKLAPVLPFARRELGKPK